MLVVGFHHRPLGVRPFPHWLFQRACVLTTPFWSGFRGFRGKLWLVNPETKTYLDIRPAWTTRRRTSMRSSKSCGRSRRQAPSGTSFTPVGRPTTFSPLHRGRRLANRRRRWGRCRPPEAGRGPPMARPALLSIEQGSSPSGRQALSLASALRDGAGGRAAQVIERATSGTWSATHLEPRSFHSPHLPPAPRQHRPYRRG